MNLDDELARVQAEEASKARAAEEAAKQDMRLSAEIEALTERFLKLANEKALARTILYWTGHYVDERKWTGRRTGHKRFERSQAVHGWVLLTGAHGWDGYGRAEFLAVTEAGQYVTGDEIGLPADRCAHYATDGGVLGRSKANNEWQVHRPDGGTGRFLNPEKIGKAMAHLLTHGSALETIPG